MAENTYALSDQDYARSIELPPHDIFMNLLNAKRFAIDIGGSLAKIAYLSEVEYKRPRHYSTTSDIPSDSESEQNSNQPLYSVEEQIERREALHFIKFETKYIEDCLNFIQQNLLSSKCIKATGGGAYKYKELLTSKLDVRVEKLDEMSCLITGCNFLLTHVPNEAFQFKKDELDQPEFVFKNLDGNNIFPYLLVNIGSGVSILKVEGPDKYERIGGTSTGGGAFWGLGSLLTNAKGFDELLAMTTEGKTKNIDMLVKDIYGGGYTELNLPAELTASSFGKAARASRDSQSAEPFRTQDIAKALLQMISNDIGQISSLYAQLYGLTRIFFGGYFIRGHHVTMHTISFAINFFSKGTQQALFLRHEGYLGAIGAFISSTASPIDDDVSWRENYAGSSGFPTRTQSTCDVFELDRVTISCKPCPLLVDPSNYKPDLIDLSLDKTARTYWLTIFEDNLNHYMEQAISSQSGQLDVRERGDKFRKKFLERLHILKETPYAFGELTVRSLLDTREQFLASFSFCDPYLQVKQRENEIAISMLRKRLDYIDSLHGDVRQVELVEGLAAGNMFDWGAYESVRCFADPSFGFAKAKEKLQERPWLHDDLDKWLERLKGPEHNLVAVFVDNSGCDIILGIFPFVRELLKRGSKVILAANSYPAINDVIYSELIILCDRVGEMCPIIRSALAEERLIVMETGSNSSCLDLRRIECNLASKMQDVDLIVIEGMGRCIHTNYDVKFTCESIKCAVIKNDWLAKRLNGDLFNIIFKYDCPTG